LEIDIQGRKVGQGYHPFVVAELSGNHNQSLDRALAIVEAAAKSGAHAMKLQTYTAETMTLDLREGDFFISDPNSPWKGNSLYDLYRKAYTPWEWHKPIYDRCRELGLVCFSTPFDETSVISSKPWEPVLQDRRSRTSTSLLYGKWPPRKPVIISTGMATVSELDEAVCAAREAGCKDIILLKCTSSYPATPENSNLATIPHIRELFGFRVVCRTTRWGLVPPSQPSPSGQPLSRNTSPSAGLTEVLMPHSPWSPGDESTGGRRKEHEER
jgi:N-acetylneuraminate synthase